MRMASAIVMGTFVAVISVITYEDDGIKEREYHCDSTYLYDADEEVRKNNKEARNWYFVKRE